MKSSAPIVGQGKRRLIRSYFLVSFLLVGLGILASGLIGIYYHLSDIREQTSLLQQEIANNAALKVEQFIEEIEISMWAVTLNREIIAHGLSPDIDFQLNKLLKISAPVNEAFATDANGVVYEHVSRVRSVVLRNKQSISSTNAFDKAINGETFYGSVFFVHESEPYMSITIPIERYAGEFIGVLQSQVNLKYIWDLISKIQFGNDGYAYIVSRYGDLIAHPSISLVLQRPDLSSLDQVQRGFFENNQDQSEEESSTLVTTNLKGEKVLSSFTLIPKLDWLVVIEQPMKEAFDKFFDSLFRTSALLLFGLAMTFIASALLIRKVLRPLEVLRQGAESIGVGDLSYRFNVKTGDEFEIVSNEFNNMAKAIQDSHANLEDKVASRTREITESNRALEKTRKELEELNKSLEDKVKSQVSELERINRIKHFLPPTVSEAILKSDVVDPFQTHRKEITSVFIDLRGFTNFSDSHEPEEVMQVLREYHEAVGKLIDKYGGTLEHFAGDGIMIFFNDPRPQNNHIELAVRMSLEVQQRVGEIRPEWHRKGYNLDVGIGLTTGFATLGILGFEGRLEYGVIGNVPNLAARLSGEAKGGQIVIDRKTYSRIDNLIEVQSLGELSLKGFSRSIPAYSILSLST
ncbi:MAG: HAMP domain-containing protein [Desulfobacterales bacterium]|nr:Cache 3/Cache 2 fusion domain-containing protein [Deltaproteobacteria bacterium]NNK92961.1 HAMP domain-containing protein [Desulfobacterales bacterium]